jgi:pyruvate,water dikinase
MSERQQYVLDLRQIDETQIAVAGGKGAHLGVLARIEGVRVPDGFCVTTDAFRRTMAEAPSIEDELERLAHVDPDDREAIRTLSAKIRRVIEETAVPADIAASITRALAGLGEDTPCAVRSSATAEDLPTASFAGQQDTYLNVVGTPSVLRHVSRCWASLFTERAVTYRRRNGIATALSTWPSSCSGWSSPRRPAFSSRPIPSPATGRSPPWTPASASARPWSPVW